MKVVCVSNLGNNIHHNMKRIIAVSTMAAIGAIGAHLTANSKSDVFQLQPKVEVNKSDNNVVIDKKYSKSISKSFPYINNGLFRDLNVKDNKMVIDNTYKLFSKDGKVFEGQNGFWENQKIYVQKAKNDSYNVVYEVNDNKQVVSFHKNGKLMNLSEAVQNNKDGSIKRFNNPLSKELKNSIANVLSYHFSGDVEYVDNHINVKCPTKVIRFENKQGLFYSDEDSYIPSSYHKDIKPNAINVVYLDNGGYTVKITSGSDNKTYDYSFTSDNKMKSDK